MRWIRALLMRLHFLPDAVYLRLAYFFATGRILHLKNPRTFNEKLNWLKLHGVGAGYARFVDKLAVRTFITKTIGAEYLPGYLSVHNQARYIDWFSLPDKYIAKCTHGSHCSILCRDKKAFDYIAATEKLEGWMRTNWFWYGREKPYKILDPRVIIERLVADNPINYKIMCFHGEPEVVQVHKKVDGKQTIDFFVAYGERIEAKKKGFDNSTYPWIDKAKLKDMLPIARKLAHTIGAPYVRVDLYHEQGRVWFGELTFYDSAGFKGFEPHSFDIWLGEKIHLPKKGLPNAKNKDSVDKFVRPSR
jgi:hypothetical protein